MRMYRVLVTGVGTIIGYGIINSLHRSSLSVHIVGMDMNTEAVGKAWCDEYIIAVAAASPSFIDFLKTAIDEYQIDLVFLGTEQEMHTIASNKAELAEYYKKIVINNDAIITISEDKWDTYNFLKNNNLCYIKSMISGDYPVLALELGAPFLVKPRRSYSSRGIAIIRNEYELIRRKEIMGDQFMAQQLIGDEFHEYTASTFAFGDGTCIDPIVMRRKLSFEGATLNAYVESIEEIKHQIFEIVKLLKPIGPTNFQFRKGKDEKYYLLETNPRISSATSIRAAFGFNEAELCLKYFVDGMRFDNVSFKMGRAYRYIADYVEVF